MLYDGDDVFDTTFDVDSIPGEEISPYLVRSPLEMNDERRTGEVKGLENDFEEDAKDVTEEIVRGFILEKGIINEEHEKEKREIINSLMKDREELIEKFKRQVMEVEKKLNKHEEDGGKQGDLGTKKSERRLPLYIRLDERNVIGAEGLLSRLQFEDRFESEKDTLERNLRDEKRLLKDRLEMECERKLQFETRRFQSTVEDLRAKIKELRLENNRLGKELKNKELETKSRIAELKSRWSGEKARFDMEKYKIRNELERELGKEMDLQRSNYEKMLDELKNDFKEASRSISKKEEQVSIALSGVKDYEARVRNEIVAKVKDEYQGMFAELRQRNERLVDQVDKLTQENSRLAGRLRELNDHNENRMSVVNEFTTRLNREYEDRLKTTVLENEALKAEVEELRKENRIQEGALRDFRESTVRLEEELTVKNGLLAGSEEKKESLRRELTDFSNEIDALRQEKSDLLKSVDDCSENESKLVEKMSKKDKQTDDALDKFRISERERMGLERKMAMLSEEHEKCLQTIESLKNELRKGDEEAFMLKKLLEEERKEHDRFRERFRRDAEEIRGRESECQALREQLRSKTSKMDSELDKSAERVDNLMALETENFELQKKLKEYEEGRGDMVRREREEIQKQFAKEFAKRIYASKRSYEEAADGLKSQIKMLRSKVTELEGILAVNDIGKSNENGYDLSAVGPKRRGPGNNDISGLGYLSKASRRKTNTDYFESSDINPSSVDSLDYASNCKPNTTTSKPYRSAPAEDTDLSMSKRRNVDSRARVYQGSFSRQRSRSVDSSVGRFTAEGSQQNLPKTRVKRQGFYSERLPVSDRASNEATERKETEASAPRVSFSFQKERRHATKAPTGSGENYAVSKQMPHGGECNGNYEDLRGLPPKYKANESLRSNKRPNGEYWDGQANGAAEKLGRSVEKLQERLEDDHNELLRRLELMQTSVR